MQLSVKLNQQVQNLETAIQCPVTLEPLLDGVALIPCMHKVNACVAQTILSDEAVKKRCCPICRKAVETFYDDPLCRKIAKQAALFVSRSEKGNMEELAQVLYTSLLPLIVCPQSGKYLEQAAAFTFCQNTINASKAHVTMDYCRKCLSVQNILPDHFIRGIVQILLQIKIGLPGKFFDIPKALFQQVSGKIFAETIRSYLTAIEVTGPCLLVSKYWQQAWREHSVTSRAVSKPLASATGKRKVTHVQKRVDSISQVDLDRFQTAYEIGRYILSFATDLSHHLVYFGQGPSGRVQTKKGLILEEYCGTPSLLITPYGVWPVLGSGIVSPWQTVMETIKEPLGLKLLAKGEEFQHWAITKWKGKEIEKVEKSIYRTFKEVQQVPVKKIWRHFAPKCDWAF